MTPDGWDWQVVFDGGSLGNPGRGYGTFRIRRLGGDWSAPVRREYGEGVTNNEAEYFTLIAALEHLQELAPNPSKARVQVVGDSQLVIRQVRGEWKIKAPHLAPMVSKIRALARSYASVDFRWHARAGSVALLGH